MTKKSIALFSTLVLAGLSQAPAVSATTTTATSSTTMAQEIAQGTPSSTPASSSALVQERKTFPSTSSATVSEATAPVTADNSDPSKLNQKVVVQQTQTALSITYARSPSQQGATIHYAIWSDENGQDDLNWYQAGETTTDIPLANLGTAGTYHLHTYIRLNNQDVFLSADTFQLQAITPTLSTSIVNGQLEVSVSNLPTTVSEVLLPTWSEKNGQDDLNWYRTTRNGDGTAFLRIPLKQHRFDTGIYNVHLYTKDKAGVQRFVTSTKTPIASNQIPTIEAPDISIQNLNATNGTYRIQVQEKTNTKPIKTVEIATWSTANQSNLKWRTASGGNGTYISDISFQEHQVLAGHYQNHVYVTYTDGTRVGYVAQTVDLSQARLPISIQTSLSSIGNISVNLGNIPGAGTVHYAVWSEEGGQDDLRWYQATKTGSSTYSGSIPLVVHSGNGTFNLHVYQDNVGLGTSTFQVTESQRSLPVTTYEVGECTWGAKTLAPWAGNFWGNGGQWADSAINAGFRVGSTPKVGAIAVWSGATGYGGGYGHVAVVVDVQSTTSIRVKEANYQRKRYIGDFRGWFNPVADGVTAYIYPN